ncbi:hypothetical protein BXT86_02810 [candidate division WOR-3 bacterium 4484_100]|uniref:Histone deacetylase domain-containing protein n=1 Tax=candidate division WOR-3 bacterium 4484_100 TaxID=1936077 RepID=A0A1V4QFJ4_UNCW3|nr:MAG: hypothetical protein BXT86_02810 [candidate division WOR-3 bacterium 4484_100]
MIPAVYTPKYQVDIGPHVFPTEKYPLIYERLSSEGIITKERVYAPKIPDKNELTRIVEPEYLDDLLNTRPTACTLSSEMPVNQGIIEAQLLCCGGTYLASQLALKDGCCYHIGGGFHHAFPSHAEGFCFLNDIVYAGVKLLEQGIERIAVVDCDLHQGNGTAKFFEHEPRVFTFSIHQEHLYPIKEKSDLDIGLENGTGDDEYLELLDSALNRIFKEFNPQFIIYVAGADPYIYDQLGSLRLSIKGLKRRDELVIGPAIEHKIPLIVVLGGGYAVDLNDTVEIHCNTARVMDTKRCS